MAHILLRHRDIKDLHKLDVYRANGGYEALTKCLKEYSPDEVINVVRQANIKGRGGAGFPAGTMIPVATIDGSDLFGHLFFDARL